MTQPSEKAFRKALEEAGCGEEEEELEYVLSHTRGAFPQAIRALARRIEAEAVPVTKLWPGLDHIANFINALDSEGMTAKDVRTAIYTECLEPKHRAAPPKGPTT